MAAKPATPIERKLRADAYVLGRMSTLERDQAQADLETDAQFRDEVLRAAHRLGFGGAAEGREARTQAGWAEIAEHLGALPHMGGRAMPAQDAERSPTVPLAGSEIGSGASRFTAALRDTWRTVLALVKTRRT